MKTLIVFVLFAVVSITEASAYEKLAEEKVSFGGKVTYFEFEGVECVGYKYSVVGRGVGGLSCNWEKYNQKIAGKNKDTAVSK